MGKHDAKHIYTEEEIDFIYKNHSTMTVKEIANALGIESDNSVRNKMYSLGLKVKKKTVFSEDGKLKRCPKCEQYLPVEYFGNHSGKPRARCRRCEYNKPDIPFVSTRKMYTSEEVEFLKLNHDKYTYAEFADILNVSVDGIRAKLYSLGLKAKTKKVYSDDGSMKACSKCGQFFPISEYKSEQSKSMKSACRACSYEAHFNRKKAPNPNKKPTFEELISRTKKGFKNCTSCGILIDKDNCIIKNTKNRWEITPTCKSCANKKNKERVLKRLAERGY